MNKSLELKKLSLLRACENEPFLMNLNDTLNLQIITEYDLSSAIILLKNGEIEDRYRLTPNFTVPQKFLFTGKLKINIAMLSEEKVIKRWEVLPIEIREVNDEIIFTDSLAELEKRVTALEEKNKIIL